MFLALVVLMCPQTGLGAIGLSTLLTEEILLDPLVLLLNAAAVDVLGDFLHICNLLVVTDLLLTSSPPARAALTSSSVP